ncbi:MAG: sialate O-acetylesterase [Paludibacter sp.]|nr:sialate O-acetylesterase [Paludibacter sp.]
MKKNTFLLLFCLIITTSLFADVKPAALFCEHMVLQRGVEIPVWGKAWPKESVSVSLNGTSVTVKADASGNWMLKLPKQKAGGPYKLEIAGDNIITFNDVYVGEVWLCSGQSNMDMTVAKEDRYWCGVNNEAEEVANANYPQIRVFDVDFTPSNSLKEDVVGKWEVCSPQTVGHFSAVAYFFAREIYKKLNIPMGMVTSAFGASTAETWISKEAMEAHPNLKPLLDSYAQKWNVFTADSAMIMPKYREDVAKFKGDLAAAQAAAGDVTSKKPKAPKNPDPELDQHNPYVCYNGMIAPLIPYAIKGALWYQGESNGPSAKNYREIMETLITDWRTRWAQGNFPFLYVQLANYGKPMTEPVKHEALMTVREAQVQNLSIPNTGMAVAIENAGDQPTNIHPKNKQAIGYRLGLIARAKVYGERVEYSGPMYKNYKIKKNTIVLTFDHVGKGLLAKDEKLTGFAICGEDKKWVFADAVIAGKKVIVSGKEVEKPVAVRYCWGVNPPASLSNKDGLWTPNFRTDNW